MFLGIGPAVVAEVVAGASLAVLGVVVVFLFKRLPRELGQLSRDWFGQPARPGFPEVPGVPQRLQNVESNLGELREFAVKIDHEMHPNSGTSIKDQVTKTASDVARLQTDVSGVHDILAKRVN